MKNYKIANFSKDPAGWEDGNPFHGDHYILETIYEYMKNADLFIDTGTAYAEKCVFWFDSHGEWYENGERKYSWPLKEEVAFVTNNLKNYVIFIDDFQNPFVNVSYDICGGHVCGPDEVKSVLNGAKLYHPTYTNATSKYHSNIVGIGMITDMDVLCNVAGFKENV